MSNKPSLQAGRPTASLEKVEPAKVESGTERMNIHFTTANARKLRLYAATHGMRPSATLNEIVEALDMDVPPGKLKG